MKAMQIVFFAAIAGLSLLGHTAEAKDKWVCMKDQAEVKVTGKNAKDKQKACEGKGGIWEKGHTAAKQTSGSGAAW